MAQITNLSASYIKGTGVLVECPGETMIFNIYKAHQLYYIFVYCFEKKFTM
jgi:hypothetical protein